MIILENNEMQSLISSTIIEELKSFTESIQSILIQDDRPLTAKEAMAYLSMTKSTFYRYVRNGYIHKYGMGDAIYYKKSQLDSAIKKIN